MRLKTEIIGLDYWKAGLSRWHYCKDLLTDAGDARDSSSVPGLGRPPGGMHGNPLQSSCLENLLDRGTWQAIAHRVAESEVTARTQAGES